MNIYDFKVLDNKGQEVSLADYKDKVLLVVNTATKCGLTPQYEALETLYNKFKDQGFEILDFPSNQFLQQAPGTDEEINTFCTLTYNTTFPRFHKTDVNGAEQSPLFKWLKEEKPEDHKDETSDAFEEKINSIQPRKEASDILWNFTKFIIDKNGNVVERIAPSFAPNKLESMIQELL